MIYLKENINSFYDSNKVLIEVSINNKVNTFCNLVINFINNNSLKKITLTMHSCDTLIYSYKDEIVNRLKVIFPSMKITTQYITQDMEYFNITFDWN